MAQNSKAAERFLDSIEVAWDHGDCYTRTADEGLSDVDADALMALCEEEGEDYFGVENIVMVEIRAKAHAIRRGLTSRDDDDFRQGERERRWREREERDAEAQKWERDPKGGWRRREDL